MLEQIPARRPLERAESARVLRGLRVWLSKVESLPAWFAGVPLGALEKADCQSELPFYNALGFAVLATAVLSSVSLTIALSYVLQRPAQSLWPVWVFWFPIILNIERLLQIGISASKWLLVAMLPRLLVTFVIGTMISEPLMVIVNHPEISMYLHHQTQIEVQQNSSQIANNYAPKIAAAQAQINQINASEAALQNEIIQDKLIAGCEANEPTCSLTGQPGCGNICIEYLNKLNLAEQQLAAQQPVDAANIARLRGQLQRLRAAEAAAQSSGRASITSGNGFLAQEEALDHLMARHAVVAFGVWLLRSGIWLLDLLPLLLKVLYVTLAPAPYERTRTAEARRSAGRERRIDGRRQVEDTLGREQDQADIEVGQVKIYAERDRQIADIESQWVSPGTFAGSPTASWEERIDGVDSDGLHRRKKDHVLTTAAPMPPALRAAGWVGTALVTGTAVALATISYFGHVVIGGEWLPLLLLPPALALTAFTHGYQEAPRWALKATFGTLVIGLALPIVLVGLNL